MRLAGAAKAGGRRLAHGLDAAVLGVLMEIVARVVERQLLSLVQEPSPDGVAGDQSAAAELTPR